MWRGNLNYLNPTCGGQRSPAELHLQTSVLHSWRHLLFPSKGFKRWTVCSTTEVLMDQFIFSWSRGEITRRWRNTCLNSILISTFPLLSMVSFLISGAVPVPLSLHIWALRINTSDLWRVRGGKCNGPQLLGIVLIICTWNREMCVRVEAYRVCVNQSRYLIRTPSL